MIGSVIYIAGMLTILGITAYLEGRKFKKLYGCWPHQYKSGMTDE